MAIIDKNTNEYYKIIQHECYANIDGLYLSVAMYDSEAERIKEKNRENLILEYINNMIVLEESIPNIEEIGDHHPILIYYHLFDRTIVPKNNQILGLDGFTEDQVREAEKYGFDRKWFIDPVIIGSKFIIRVKDYDGDSFDLESLYGHLKNRFNGSYINGDLILFNDDL